VRQAVETAAEAVYAGDPVRRRICVAVVGRRPGSAFGASEPSGCQLVVFVVVRAVYWVRPLVCAGLRPATSHPQEGPRHSALWGLGRLMTCPVRLVTGWLWVGSSSVGGGSVVVVDPVSITVEWIAARLLEKTSRAVVRRVRDALGPGAFDGALR